MKISLSGIIRNVKGETGAGCKAGSGRLSGEVRDQYCMYAVRKYTQI